MPTPSTSQPRAQLVAQIVILGTDAVLAALPATPVQLAHACLRAGFANVIPASWGDEIIATAALRRLDRFGEGPVIQCSCPYVAHRLLAVGSDLRPLLLPLVPPPVAIARYVRALSPSTPTRITFVGACPGAVDESIDIRMTPEALISMLAERQIEIPAQPRVFESIIPPDRRRYRSMPGGVPTAEALWAEQGDRSLVEVSDEDFVAEISQLVLSGDNVLIDPSVALGCACSGAVGEDPTLQGRARVMALEPPRASLPVVPEDKARIEVDLPLPAMSRTPVDIVAVPANALTRPIPAEPMPPESIRSASMPFGHRISPISGLSEVADVLSPRPAPAPSPKPITGPTPIARAPEGRSLPRAYVARRRPSPRGIPAPQVPDAPGESPTGSWRASRLREHPLTVPQPAPQSPPEPAAMQAPLQAPLSAAQAAPVAPPAAEPPSIASPAAQLDAPRRPTPPRLQAFTPAYEPPDVPLPPPAMIEALPPPFQREWTVRILAGALIIAAAVALGVVIGRSLSKPAPARPSADSSLGIPY